MRIVKFNFPNRTGFTLIELMAAMSVLAIIVLIFSQVTGMVSETWKRGKERIDNFSQARVALGLMDRDIQSMVLRRDVAAFVDATGSTNAAFAFYTQMPGQDSARDRKISLIQYTLLDPATKPKLVRTDYGLDYGSGTPARTLKLNVIDKLSDLPDPVDPASKAQEIAEGVIGFRYQFVDGNGELQDNYQFDYANPRDLTNTSAVTISLAVLDSDNYRLIQETDKMPEVLDLLAVTPTSESFASLWRKKLNSPGTAAVLPAPIRGSIRVFERSIHFPRETVGP